MHHRFLPALLWKGALKEHIHSGNAPRLEKARLDMLALTLSIDSFFGVKTNSISIVRRLLRREPSRISQRRLRLWSQHPVMENLYRVHHQLYQAITQLFVGNQ
ncbi:hypothetical protein V6N11_035574 [Hibiscus sabdariffa]|uniref:Peptidase M48 domain-containing protein n=1 Tax=Hibiscus sabdariffa TaxID=183260 RepID=A0ABR2R0N4_9ROSI